MDLSTQEEIKGMFPEDFEERKEQLIKAGFWRGDKVTLKFLFGNIHSMEKNPKPAVSDPSKQNIHRWMMYVNIAQVDKELTGKFIEKVTYHLHPTFNPSKIEVKQYPFILSRLGWGYFEVHIEIVFKAWTRIPKMELDHMLSFENGGGPSAAFFIEVEREWVDKADKDILKGMAGLSL